MKKFKRIAAILLCMVMVLVTFNGCKKTGQEANGDNTDSTKPQTTDTDTNEDADADKLAEVDFDDHVEFSYWMPATPNDIESDYNKNSVVQYMNKKFNMTLSFQQPAAGSEADSLNIMLGTGEYTDIIDSSVYTGSIDQLYEDGIIIDIAEYLDYMPNFKAILDADPVFKKNVYNDNGRILKLPTYLTEDPLHWGGLVYRRDILETMTGNNVTFPSGNDIPTTVADWDYMLPLFKQYFEAANMAEYAPLIIPASGYFPTSELVTTFGTQVSYYEVDGEIKYGPIEDGFYNYLAKMKEWYSKGYIYKDFASRTNDLFYLPNTALTYGGAAGIWFGLTSQLGTALSQPEYDLHVDVQPIPNPIDDENGITSAVNVMYAARNEQYGGAMITSSCQNIERLLVTMDYLYSDEGAMLKEYGLTKEQGAADDELYKKHGLEDGAYTVNNDGTITKNERLLLGGGLSPDAFVDYKMPGVRNNKYTNMYLPELQKNATSVWLHYGHKKLPELYRTVEEEETYTSNQSRIDDYVNTMVLKFILGDIELNDQSWDSFKKQIESYGVNENIKIMQAAYDRYNNR